MRNPSGWPLNTSPSRNCAAVHTNFTVVNSFTVTVLGDVESSTAKKCDGVIGAVGRRGFRRAALGDEHYIGARDFKLDLVQLFISDRCRELKATNTDGPLGDRTLPSASSQ